MNERAERLREALGRLKPLDRETLVAFYIRGLTLLEMAEELDLPPEIIKRRLHTARRRLRLELEPRWPMPTSGPTARKGVRTETRRTTSPGG